ncbi:lysine--tRNA ligase [Hyphobacterium sp. SN044]|uniref:lysine--tRNA ligase n=1 Tax=Hyphobacterium sp. SN044 TaxID=2912575 RepID=UPI001F022F92|nr:lysine--tRNA ligase [Hyphobacterium sp. SN044]MCF8879701.1 lysine--tRNA ligase [Hyphobacterium sp. SN044]
MSDLPALARNAKAWPFELARDVLKRVERNGLDGGSVIFETGYGPSGLPHMGTFGEVARTAMVRHAFRVLTGDQYPTRLICFSDDMDGMRKVPSNVPNQEMLHAHLGKPLTDVPDPFATHEGFAQHNNARLRAFLDSFGFEYDFLSATQQYRSGAFDDVLLRALEKFDDIMGVMLPTLGPERQATYSPFLPISPTTGRVLYVPMKATDPKAGTITFEDEDGTDVTMTVTGGHTKLQWKPDFGMRWAALGVDFEMFGKDHQTNAPIYSRICKILGVEPPVQYVYELFLDEQGEKISKSKGNGLSVEEWLRYGTQESLSLYNFAKPRTAKRLYFDVIPKAVDEYYQHLAAYAGQEADKQLENPVWHIHDGNPPSDVPPISFALLLNLASASGAEDKTALWGFIGRYVDGATPDTHPVLDALAERAVAYYEDFVKPNKSYRLASDIERAAMQDLVARLKALDPGETDAETIQNEVYAAGKEQPFENLRDWFQGLYEVLLGQSQGPRFGGFVAVYGIPETIALIERGLAGELADA